MHFLALTNSADRSPLLAPFLASQNERRPAESVADFYSPLDSAHNSDAEEEEVSLLLKVYQINFASKPNR